MIPSKCLPCWTGFGYNNPKTCRFATKGERGLMQRGTDADGSSRRESGLKLFWERFQKRCFGTKSLLGWDLLLPIGCVNMRRKNCVFQHDADRATQFFPSDSRNQQEVINPSPVHPWLPRMAPAAVNTSVYLVQNVILQSREAEIFARLQENVKETSADTTMRTLRTLRQ